MIPSRKQIIGEKHYIDFAEQIKKKETLTFLIIDLRKQFNNLVGSAITPTGVKIAIKIPNIPLYLDFDNPDPEIINGRQFEKKNISYGLEFGPAKEFTRVYFESQKERKQFIDKALNNESGFEYVYFRDQKINTGGWNKTNKYFLIDSLSSKTKFQFSIAHDSIFPAEGPTKEPLIIGAWDLETYTPDLQGRVPKPEYPEDKIKMCSMVFKFYHSQEPIAKILISDVPLPPIEGIIVHPFRTIAKGFSHVIEQIQPDYLTGFNDGGYDWPFLKAYLSETFKKRVSFLDKCENLCGPQGENYIYLPKIKIDAENSASYNGFQIPGLITFDTAILMRRRDKLEKYWQSLNSFLKKNQLPEKIDMPYNEMSRIFYLFETARDLIPTEKKEKLKETWEDYIEAIGKLQEFNDKKNPNISLNGFDTKELLNLATKYVDVAIYCVHDSESCLNLLFKIKAISDAKELASKSFSLQEDSFYKADGHKVVNLILFHANEEKWGISKTPIAYKFKPYEMKLQTEKLKYPGGYVINPNIGPYKTRPCVGNDFSSLYPSLIMAFNISPEFSHTDLDYLLKFYPNANIVKKRSQNILSGVQNILYIKTNYKTDKEIKSESNKVEGYILLHGDNYENYGIFPTILKQLFDERSQIKKRMGKYAVIIEKIEKDIKDTKLSLPEALNILETKISEIQQKSQNWQGMKKELEENKIKNYKEAIKIIQENFKTNLQDLYDEANFEFALLNTKQNALKVFMNTFYGQMGSPHSIFFKTFVAGAVTKMGRRMLKSVREFIENLGFICHYGDTDSLYITPPDSCFIEEDREFQEGKIAQEVYYEKMVGTTMHALNELNKKITKFLEEKSRSPFLKMAYEEVLFPFALFGKKNYIGVKHFESIDFSICRPEFPMDKFKKELFQRGLPTRRRDGSNFVKDSIFEILKSWLSTSENLEDITNNYIKLKWIMAQKDPEQFRELIKKSYTFREPKSLAIGPNLQNTFRNKMIEFSKIANFPIQIPAFGDRHDLICFKSPTKFNIDGSKIKTKIGTKMEYASLFNDKAYKKKYEEFLCSQGYNTEKCDHSHSSLFSPLFSPSAKKETKECTYRHEIDIRSYFMELFNKVSRYYLHLPKWKLEVEKMLARENEYNAKGGIRFKKKNWKEAVIAVRSKIVKELAENFIGTAPVIVCPEEIKQSWKIYRSGLVSRLGKSPFLTIILNYFAKVSESMTAIELQIKNKLEVPLILNFNEQEISYLTFFDTTQKKIKLDSERKALLIKTRYLILKYENSFKNSYLNNDIQLNLIENKIKKLLGKYDILYKKYKLNSILTNIKKPSKEEKEKQRKENLNNWFAI